MFPRVIWLCLTAIIGTPLTTPAEPQAKPNIIVILADDLGYGDLGVYGSTLNTTPNLDQMAKEGIRFTDVHASSWCAPSRIALLTGNHPNRPGLLNGKKLATRITIAEMLKQNGYATGIVGKWHLGMNKGRHPLDQGFDSWYGTAGSNDWDGPRPNQAGFDKAQEEAWKTPVFRNRKKEGICPQSEFTGRYTREANAFIDANKESPFFLYVAHNMPHVPIFASDAFKGKSSNGVYGDVLMELDWSVGEILKSVKEHGLDKKTLVIFTSDNGPWTMFGPKHAGTAQPLRGEKSTTWEGGTRVPAIFHWPDTLTPGLRDDFVTLYDFYATFAALSKSPIQAGQAMDSKDFSKALLGTGNSSRRKHIFFHQEALAYRNGDYKIHFKTRERTRNPETGRPEPPTKHSPPLLFNVVKDKEESTNIAADHPELVDRLTKEFTETKKAITNWTPFD